MKSFPALVPDGIYTRAQVETNLGISPQTLTFWIEFNGLQSIQPGTRAHFFIGSEVIAFMAAHRSGISKPKSAKEKTERRKGGAK